ncbi:small multi-drug export protein [Clostridiaceae bacterium M8S5]|nr:small multi-drug export protein [Clostridiaceae bacterium M8S5]
MKKYVLVFLMSMVPIVELRGAIPVGVSMGIDPTLSLFISIVGNCLLVPILLKTILPILRFFYRIEYFKKYVIWVHKRTMSKSERVKKYEVFGLFLLVAIPVPSTGVYTGCLVATLLRIKYKDALKAILSGVITSGMIVYVLSVVIIN